MPKLTFPMFVALVQRSGQISLAITSKFAIFHIGRGTQHNPAKPFFQESISGGEEAAGMAQSILFEL